MAPNFLIYIYLHYVSSFSWCATILDTLTSIHAAENTLRENTLRYLIEREARLLIFFCYSKRGSPFISVSSSIWHFKSKKTSYQYLISNLSFCLQLSSLTHIRALIISSRVVLIVISLNSVRLNKIYLTGRPGARKQWPYMWNGNFGPIIIGGKSCDKNYLI